MVDDRTGSAPGRAYASGRRRGLDPVRWTRQLLLILAETEAPTHVGLDAGLSLSFVRHIAGIEPADEYFHSRWGSAHGKVDA